MVSKDLYDSYHIDLDIGSIHVSQVRVGSVSERDNLRRG